MVTPAWFVLELFTYAVLFSTSFADDILSRLSTVESKISIIEREKEDFRSENKKLRKENANLKNRVNYLEIRFQFYKEEFETMKDRLRKAEAQILPSNNMKPGQDAVKSVGPHNKPKTQSISSSEESTAETGIEIDHVHTSSAFLSKVRRKPQERIQIENVDQKQNNKGVLKLRNESRRLLRQLPTANISSRVSFSAHRGSHLTGIGTNEAYVFDVVNNNDGQGYDEMSGIFTCPLSGTYFFTATIVSRFKQVMLSEMVVNNVPIARIAADGRNDALGSGTNSFMIYCNKGEHVWVRRYGRNGNDDVYGATFSHFGGFLLWSDVV